MRATSSRTGPRPTRRRSDRRSDRRRGARGRRCGVLRAVSGACYFFGVRLGTCIALELGGAAGALGGVALCGARASELAGDYLGTREAHAATLAPEPARAAAPEALPRAHLPVARAAAPTVFGASDTELLAPIAGRVTR